LIIVAGWFGFIEGMMNRTALAIICLLIVPHGVEARATGREEVLRPRLVCEIDNRSTRMHESPNCALSRQSRSGSCNKGSTPIGGVDAFGLQIGGAAEFNATHCGSR
jgi:hypothetical protein